MKLEVNDLPSPPFIFPPAAAGCLMFPMESAVLFSRSVIQIEYHPIWLLCPLLLLTIMPSYRTFSTYMSFYAFPALQPWESKWGALLAVHRLDSHQVNAKHKVVCGHQLYLCNSGGDYWVWELRGLGRL